MSTAADPILQLRELRGGVAGPSSQAQSRAREAMFAKRSKPPLRPIIAIAACAVTLAVVVITSAPWSHPQSAQAAVNELARTAVQQKALKLGPKDWITTRYTTKRSWTQDLTQEKLDRLTERTAASMAAANGSGHLMRSDGKPISPAEQAKVDRANNKNLDRVRVGVRLDELPTTHITAWNVSSYSSTRDASGYGGGGGGSNAIEYESPKQEQAGLILQRAGIGGRMADPVDFGGSEIADLPTRAVSNEADVDKLATTPEQMRAELADWKQAGSLPGETKQGSPLDLFVKATGVVGSPYAAPAQRAAAIRMITALPGVTITQEARDAKGRVGLGLSIAIAGGTMQIVFDRGDSRLLGMQVRINDPKAFVGDSYAGSGKNRVAVIPPFDSATIAVGYDPVVISHGDPPCTPESCLGKPGESIESLQRRIKAGARTR